MPQPHHVIVIPGLGDSRKELNFICSHWNWSNHGLQIHIYPIGWHDIQEQDFQVKLLRLLRYISKSGIKGERVSLIGVSAGGSAALNAFYRMKNDIHRVINVCGRLRVGSSRGFRSFSSRTRSSSSFAQSVRMLEKHEGLFTKNDREKIMTIHAAFGDELVPKETVLVTGAKNISVPMIEHGLSIFTALTIFSMPIIEFIKEK